MPKGQAGEIVVTHLATRDFPFIRYKTGDVAVMDDRRCDCGRGLPMLKEIQGRTTDFVVAADGTVMHGLALIYILRDLPGMQAFKVTQHTLTRCHVELVVDPSFDRAQATAGHRVRLSQAAGCAGAGGRVIRRTDTAGEVREVPLHRQSCAASSSRTGRRSGSMRDVVIMAIVLVGALAALRRPWVGVMLWTWVSLMNPHRMAYGFAYDMPVAAIAAGSTLLGLIFTQRPRLAVQGVAFGDPGHLHGLDHPVAAGGA